MKKITNTQLVTKADNYVHLLNTEHIRLADVPVHLSVFNN